MIKKIVSGTLSALLVLTSVLSADVSRSAVAGEKNSDPQFASPDVDYDLQGSNSLGKYLKKMADDNNADPNLGLLSNKKSNCFEMNSLDFDADTGTITAFSTQTEKCSIIFSFINEDTNETVKTFKSDVDTGNCIMTEKKIDTKELPKYYILKAYLADKNGNALSDTSSVDTYTKIMQEIAETDIHDFDEDRVVNFDENEDTNFIVLSDDTVIAESSDTENSLVSADFNNNTFVFEHIDESIQYLQNGDFLYVQPDEENIIAVSVENVEIDGDTATVTGSDDIDDMLAFIKFETTGGMTGADVDTSNSDENFVFPGHENETKFTLEDETPLEFRYNSRKPINFNLEASITIPFDTHAATDEDFHDDDVNLSLTGNFVGKVKLNICKKWTYTSIQFSLNPEFNITLKFEAEFTPVDLDASKFDKIKSLSDSLMQKNKDWTGRLLDIKIPTAIPGLFVDTTVSFNVIISGELSISFKWSPTIIIFGRINP